MAIKSIILIALLVPLQLLVIAVLGKDFKCSKPGTYPDPDDCRYYYECNNPRKQCRDGYKYSVEQRGCVLNTIDSQCTQPQYKCNNAGDMGAWPGDANIYYICFIDNGLLYPDLYRCPYGEIWINGICTVAVGSCNNGRLIPSEDCHSYYSCKNSQLVPHTCTPGTYFNERISGCEIGDC